MKSVFKKIVTFIVTLGIVGTMLLGLGTTSQAASKPVVFTTTMDCSVWAAPNTAEANRIKRIPAGYQVTVYPDVVLSTAGDGKLFFKTSKGAYILCKCFGFDVDDDNDNSQQTQLTKEYVQAVILSFKSIYPEGMYFTDYTNSYLWSHESGIYREGKYTAMRGTGCVAFAMEISDAIFGMNPVTIYYDVNQIRVGDIVRLDTTRAKDAHSVIILDIDDNGTFTFAESNYNSSVHWGRQMSYSDMCRYFVRGWTRY